MDYGVHPAHDLWLINSYFVLIKMYKAIIKYVNWILIGCIDSTI